MDIEKGIQVPESRDLGTGGSESFVGSTLSAASALNYVPSTAASMACKLRRPRADFERQRPSRSVEGSSQAFVKVLKTKKDRSRGCGPFLVSDFCTVRKGGVEPPRAVTPTGSLVQRVYQFRHFRKVGCDSFRNRKAFWCIKSWLEAVNENHRLFVVSGCRRCDEPLFSVGSTTIKWPLW